MLSWKGDKSGAGLYANETRLVPQNVNSKQFGNIANFQVDGQIMAQPLIVANLDMGALGVHNALIVATEHDSIFAFDVDGKTKTPLWQRSFLSSGVTPGPATTFGGRTGQFAEVGITGTPVIDPATNALYAVTTVTQKGAIRQELHSIDVRSGKDFGAGSVVIQGRYPGNGRSSVNGEITFGPHLQNQRPGLLLLNGVVYIAWGSFSDTQPYHGWLMAYDAVSLQQLAIFNPTPTYVSPDPGGDDGGGGGIWQSGAAVTADSDGNVYVVSADGSETALNGGADYGDGVLKLHLTGNTFNILDWFSPFNQACINEADLEIGSGGVALLPEGIAAVNLVAVTTKEGRLYLLDRDNLGHFDANDARVWQRVEVGANQCKSGMGASQADGTTWNRLYGNPSYWNGNLYMALANGPLRQYTFQNGKLNPSPASQSSNIFGVRGANTVVSANGQSGGIVWAYEKGASGTILHAYDATSVANELWNSNMNATDKLTNGEPFHVPVVFNGRVYAAANQSVYIYGLH